MNVVEVNWKDTINCILCKGYVKNGNHSSILNCFPTLMRNQYPKFYEYKTNVSALFLYRPPVSLNKETLR